MHPQSRGCKRAGPFEGAQTSKNAAKLQRGALIRLHRSLLHGAVLPHEFCVEDRVLDQRRRVGAKQLSIEASLERDGAPTLVLRGWKAPAFVQPHKELVIHVVIFLIVPFAAHRRHSARCAGGSCALQCHSLPVETRLKLSGTGRFSTVPVAFRPPRYTPLAQIDLNATFRRPLALPPLSGLCAGRTESEKRDSRANRVFARCETVADSTVVSSSRGSRVADRIEISICRTNRTSNSPRGASAGVSGAVVRAGCAPWGRHLSPKTGLEWRHCSTGFSLCS